MKLKPNVLKILEIVLHVVGFPLLLIIATILNINVISKAAQYGISAFIYAIIIILFAGIYYAAYFILISQEKKRRGEITKQNESAKNLNLRHKIVRKADPARRTGIILAIIVVCCLSGFWAFFDIAMPEPLATATSRTLFIEDLSDGWNERANVNQELLDEYITRAYNAGKLTNGTLDEYLKQGVKNPEVVKVMTADFESIDKNGYASFVGPSIDFAQNGRMTISAIVHLLLDDRNPVADKKTGERLDQKVKLTTFVVTKSIPAQDTQTKNEKKIELNSNYSYIRSNQKYFLYNNTLEKAGTDLDSLIVYEITKSHKKIQFLAGSSENKSYIYTIDVVDGLLTYVEQQYFKGNLTKETTIKQKAKGGITIHIYSDENDPVDFDLIASVSGDHITCDYDDYDVITAIDDANSILCATEETLIDYSAKPRLWDYESVCLKKDKVIEYATWDIFDMLGTSTDFPLPLDMIKSFSIDTKVGGVQISLTGEGILQDFKFIIDDVLDAVAKMISEEAIVGSDVFVTLDTDTGILSIVPCNEERGTLDYMKQAWLQNNGLIYIIVSLFSLRKLFLCYAGFIALTSFLIGIVREYRFRDEEEEAQNPEDETPSEEEENSEATVAEAQATDI